MNSVRAWVCRPADDFSVRQFHHIVHACHRGNRMVLVIQIDWRGLIAFDNNRDINPPIYSPFGFYRVRAGWEVNARGRLDRPISFNEVWNPFDEFPVVRIDVVAAVIGGEVIVETRPCGINHQDPFSRRGECLWAGRRADRRERRTRRARSEQTGATEAEQKHWMFHIRRSFHI